ncbi:hypothetical protein COBT_002612, partial [Conglomerata obtusa]
MKLILLYLSKIAINEILLINCAIAIDIRSDDRKRISESNRGLEYNQLPPKKRIKSSYQSVLSSFDFREYKVLSPTQQEAQQEAQQKSQQNSKKKSQHVQRIDKSQQLRVFHCENSTDGIIILAYLNDLQYAQALQSKFITYYEQGVNTMEFDQAAINVLIKQFEQTQWLLETIRDTKDITTFLAIEEAQAEFKCNIFKAIDNLNIQNISDIQVNEYESQEKINNHEDIRTGFEIMSDKLSENPKKSKTSSKDFLSDIHEDIITKLLEVEAKIMQIKEDIIALKAAEDEVAEKHMGNEGFGLAIEDSIIKKAEEILNAMYAINNARAKQTMKVAPARNAVEMEKARQIVEDVTTNHAIECRLEQHVKEHGYAKQKKQDEIARQAVAIEEARQTEESEMAKQHKASKNNMNVKNTRSAVEYTITQPA